MLLHTNFRVRQQALHANLAQRSPALTARRITWDSVSTAECNQPRTTRKRLASTFLPAVTNPLPPFPSSHPYAHTRTYTRFSAGISTFSPSVSVLHFTAYMTLADGANFGHHRYPSLISSRETKIRTNVNVRQHGLVQPRSASTTDGSRTFADAEGCRAGRVETP